MKNFTSARTVQFYFGINSLDRQNGHHLFVLFWKSGGKGISRLAVLEEGVLSFSSSSFRFLCPLDDLTTQPIAFM